MGEHTMEFLHFPENITRLRQAQGLTQKVLADHIGVTKASVSKWERGQSLPDAPVLAELASFFGVTLDELVGYEPQLGREQIRRIYRELAEDFAKKPFAEVMAVCRRYIRRYGSCWPFLLQMAGLLLNHAPLAPTPEERRDALDEAESLCRRVRERCSDPGLASDASYQEAAAALLRGAPILHGDAFFDRLEPWIARMELGGDAPRRLRLAAQDAVRALRHPAFAPLRADAAFAALEKNLQEEANHVEN